MNIEKLELPTRVHNCLARSGIRTVEQLVELSSEDLMKVRNLGKKNYTVLLAYLEYHGLKLRDGLNYYSHKESYTREHTLEWLRKRNTPVLGASLNEHEETPDPYEMEQLNGVLWARVALLEEKVKYLTEKCAEQKEILEIFAERLKLSSYPMDDVYTFEVSRVRNPKEFDVIAKWLKE